MRPTRVAIGQKRLFQKSNSGNGVQTLNGYALVTVLLGFCPYIPAAVLLLVPRVARWFGRR